MNNLTKYKAHILSPIQFLKSWCAPIGDNMIASDIDSEHQQHEHRQHVGICKNSVIDVIFSFHKTKTILFRR